VSWTNLFLACFVIGFVLSALAFAFGALDLQFHIHVPFVHHLHVPHGHAPLPAHAAGVSPINFATTMAFLAWFGGTGYLLTTAFGWLAVPALAGALAAGLAGASVVFWVMAHVLWSPDENMRSVDDRMVGVLGRVGTPIRQGGTGELIYTHGGTRHSCAARSADGRAIAKGVEVIVTAYDRGIAFVQPWEDFAAQS
jgi:membrane protein implicated in regulation of membrane protease activity